MFKFKTAKFIILTLITFNCSYFSKNNVIPKNKNQLIVELVKLNEEMNDTNFNNSIVNFLDFLISNPNLNFNKFIDDIKCIANIYYWEKFSDFLQKSDYIENKDKLEKFIIKLIYLFKPEYIKLNLSLCGCGFIKGLSQKHDSTSCPNPNCIQLNKNNKIEASLNNKLFKWNCAVCNENNPDGILYCLSCLNPKTISLDCVDTLDHEIEMENVSQSYFQDYFEYSDLAFSFVLDEEKEKEIEIGFEGNINELIN